MLDVLLAGIHGGLAHLEAQLGSGVIDEPPESGWHVGVGALLLAWHAVLLCIAIAALGLRGRLRRRRRAQLGDGRDMLRDGVVERW